MTRQKGKGPQRRPPSRPATSGTATTRPRFTEAESRRRRRLAILGIVFFGTTGILAATMGRTDRKADIKRKLVNEAIAGGTCTVDEKFDEGRDHVDDPSYTVSPPAGGDHRKDTLSPAIYDSVAIPADGELVHAEEHGFVILWHRPDAPAADIEGLRTLQKSDPGAVFVVPRESLPVPVAATAWHHRMLCPDGFDQKAMAKFVLVWRDQGPEHGFVKDLEKRE